MRAHPRALGIGLLVVLCVIAAQRSLAHDSRPVYVEITQIDAARYLLAWKTPGSVSPENIPAARLTPPCEPLANKNSASLTSAQHEQQRVYDCGVGGAPRAVRLQYPLANPSLATIVRLQRTGVAAEVVYASPQTEVIVFSGAGVPSAVLAQYVQLGVQHIATGYDHLLFVACLVLLAVSFRRIVWAVTGFTLAHSVTLALASLDLVRVPTVPVEAVIALSIVFLAAELARENTKTLTRRFPALTAMLFGLLHGFGFAAVLQEIGLPVTERFLALFAFNLGVELGQLVFVGLLLLVVRLGLRRWDPAQLNRVVVYPVGLIASCWLWQRVIAFFQWAA